MDENARAEDERLSLCELLDRVLTKGVAPQATIVVQMGTDSEDEFRAALRGAARGQLP